MNILFFGTKSGQISFLSVAFPQFSVSARPITSSYIVATLSFFLTGTRRRFDLNVTLEGVDLQCTEGKGLRPAPDST